MTTVAELFHRIRRADPVLTALMLLTVAVLPVFALVDAPARVLLLLYWGLQAVFEAAFAVAAVRIARRFRAGEQDGRARAGRRFWRYSAVALASMSVGCLVQMVRVVHGPMDRAALMGNGFLLVTVLVGILLLTVGLLRHPSRAGTPHGQNRLRLDIATVLAGAATFGVLIVRLPTGVTGLSWVLELAAGILVQPILFLLLLFGVLRLAFSGQGPFTRPVGATLGLAAVVQAVTQAIPETVYLGDGDGEFWAFGANLVGCGLAAVGARLQLSQTISENVPARPERPFTGLPYAAMVATWALGGLMLIDQGTTWRSWAVLAGTSVTTALIVCRQLLAFRHISHLLRERDELTARLADLAFRDGLTGLVNRTAFIDALGDRLHSGVPVTVLLIDLDRFKPVNDTFGHATGDRLLIEVARRLRARTRAEDTVARLGGDEFAVLATGLDAYAAEQFAAQMRHTLTGTVTIGAARVPLSGSIGMVTGISADYDPDALLHAADMDMYARKRKSRTVLPPDHPGTPSDQWSPTAVSGGS
jgi:diguanylate cyclase (GGDEF)-like protein